jgi:hypothetical protein
MGKLIFTAGQPAQDPSQPTTARLIVVPEADPQKAGRFTVRLESTCEVIVGNTRQPLADSARALLDRGFDPAGLLTMRMRDRPYDSFEPAPVGELSQWTYREGEKQALQRRRWMPFAASAGGQKSGIEPASDISARLPARFVPALTVGSPGSGGRPWARPPRHSSSNEPSLEIVEAWRDRSAGR